MILVEQTFKDGWLSIYPEIENLFDDLYLVLNIDPSSFRPIWGETSEILRGTEKNVVNPGNHELEGFIVNLGQNCNCASVYYLLRDLERLSKENCDYKTVQIRDYINPDLTDIKLGQDYTTRDVALEIESTSGSLWKGEARAYPGLTMTISIL
ncbi:hypothetical protein [Okeania sp. SIO2B9]|uniref:hypothetical protein n=1 Tax=Okeania sp. SIO2B9 TaxID=2607782 RepID=UPI00257B126E|nr:hypothetical protein [Okeania sp. SIO2B9]